MMSTSRSPALPGTKTPKNASRDFPRNAKRPRHDSGTLEPTTHPSLSSHYNTHNMRIRPAPSSSQPSTGPACTIARMSEESVTPLSTGQTQLPPARKRGRKPHSRAASVPRSVRELQRKVNHSRIERVRREKINDALDALRDLVPSNVVNGEAQSSTSGRSPSSKSTEKNKEFKLDILERTVLFVRQLEQKVDMLEKQIEASTFCSAKDAIASQRQDGGELGEVKCEVHAFVHRNDDTRVGLDNSGDRALRSDSSTVFRVASTSAVQLPSISSWLGKADIDR